MRLLGIDPGHHTGIVLFDTDTGIMSNSTELMSGAIEKIKYLSAHTDIVVLEEGPIAGSKEQALRVLKVSENIENTNIIWLRPADWKPFIKAQNIKPETKLNSQHENDAYGMIMYILRTRPKIWEKK